jgi:hypothetical protein
MVTTMITSEGAAFAQRSDQAAEGNQNKGLWLQQGKLEGQGMPPALP